MSTDERDSYVKVVFPFTAARDDELTVSEGDTVKVLKRLDDNWSRGESRYGVGVFPINHTTPCIRDVSPLGDGENGRRQKVFARGVFDFVSDSSGDLRFREHDMIEVIGEVNEEWWEGRLHGMRGIFPKSFVKLESKTGASVTQNGKNNFVLPDEATVLRNGTNGVHQPGMSAVVLRKKKPVPRPRTVIVSKSDIITEASLVSKDDLFVKQLSKPEPRPRIVSCPKPMPRPRPRSTPQATVDLNMTSAVNVTDRAISGCHHGVGPKSRVVIASPLSNGLETCHTTTGNGGDDAFNELWRVRSSRPAVKLKPRLAPKPPVATKSNVKVQQCHNQVTKASPLPAGKQTATIMDMGVVSARPVPRPRSQIIMALSDSSEQCVDTLVSQLSTSCPGVAKPKPRQGNVSRQSDGEQQEEQQHLLSPPSVKVYSRDSFSSYDSGISITDPFDIDQKIRDTKERLRLETKMAQVIQTTLRHVSGSGTSESPTLRLKMERCKDTVDRLRAELKNLQSINENESIEKAVIDLPRVVIARSSDEEQQTSHGKSRQQIDTVAQASDCVSSETEESRSGHDDMIDMEQGSDEHSPSPVSPTCHDLVAKRARNRARVIEELIETERRYIADLTLGCKNVQCSLKLQQIDGLDVDTLFGNMQDVAEVSHEFLNCLMENKENDKLGECFMSKADALKEVYSKYSCNHDDASALLEKYEEVPDIQQAFATCLKSVKDELACLPLSALLIKPVQRILKYPLLLNELIKCTEDDHPEKAVLLKAADVMADVAQQVNESKRRKDLVLHYRKSEADGLLTKFGRLNLHTWKKKTQRARQMVSQGLGFSLGTVDEAFNRVCNQFRELALASHSLLKDVSVYLLAVQTWHQCHVTACNTICEFYSERSSLPAVAQYSDFHHKLLTQFNSEHMVRVDRLVIAPLRQLKSLFESPMYLIEKREHKLLDYDSWKNKVSNTQSREKVAEYKEEMVMAGRMYEALNTQLLADLPLFIGYGMKVIQHSLTAFVYSHRQHIVMAREAIKPLMECAVVKSRASADTLIDDHLKRLAVASERLLSCHCISNSLLTSVNSQQRQATSPKELRRAATNRQTAITGLMSLSPRSSSNSPVSSRPISPIPRAPDRHVCPCDWLYQVEFSFTAGGDGELSVNEGDRVSVKQKHDESGSSEWWLVGCNEKEGFVPSTFLTPIGDDVYCVEYDFDGDDDDGELSMREGQFVRVRQQHDDEGNPDWWLCESEEKAGYIPASYLTNRDGVC